MRLRLLNGAGSFARGRLIAQRAGVLGNRRNDGEGRGVPKLRGWDVRAWPAYLQLIGRESGGDKVRCGPTLGEFLARKQVVGVDVCRGGWNMSGIGEGKVFGLFRVVSDVLHLIQKETYLSCGRVKIYLRDGIFLKSIAGRRREEEAKKFSQGILLGDLVCIFGLRISRRIIPLYWIWLIHVGSSIREQRERVGISLRVRRVERVACELAPEFEVTSWGRNVAFGEDRGVVAWGGGDLEGGLVVSTSGRRDMEGQRRVLPGEHHSMPRPLLGLRVWYGHMRRCSARWMEDNQD